MLAPAWDSRYWNPPAVQGGGPRVVVGTAAFHARVRGSVPGLGGFKETKNVSSPSTCASQYMMISNWTNTFGLNVSYKILQRYKD